MKKFQLNFIAIVAFLALIASSPALAQEAQTPAPNSAASSTTSYNWAGYVSGGQNFTSVTGSWAIPTVTATNSVSADAAWVGIGGVKTTDLIQAGTLYQSGQYLAWYETLPNSIHPINLAVKASDSVTVSLTQTSPGQWQINFTNNTTGQSYQTAVGYNSSLSSVEWVEEMPSSNFGFIPLDNFGTVNFTNASATENGQNLTISQLGANAMTMLNASGQIIAQPSSLTAAGNGFSVTRTSAAANQPSSGLGFTRQRTSRVGTGMRSTHRQSYTIPVNNNSFGFVFRFR